MPDATRNEVSDAIHLILDSLSAFEGDLSILDKVYDMTLKALKTNNNQLLWFSTSIKLATVHISRGNSTKAHQLIQDLRRECQNQNGDDNVQQFASELLEIYALEIQLCTLTNNSMRMKKLYPSTVSLTGAFANPRSIAVIRESGGKMFMQEKQWGLAYTEFSKAFRSYQRIGNIRAAKTTLKYLVLANMLSLSDINPFDSPDAKAYQDDSEICGLRRLRLAFEKHDVAEINEIMNNARDTIAPDSFMERFLDDLMRNIRLQVLTGALLPYSNVKLESLADDVGAPVDEVRAMLVKLIVDGTIDGAIDDIDGDVRLRCSKEEASGYETAEQWAESLNSIRTTLLDRLRRVPGTIE
eukprot:GHVT01100548.1.p1 GENE.GHVT01100548.1~~GHVT01100548.1.p1  ORF type:complete len:355 (+),score=17.00 GHVT01100548.1:993-2057(+)